MDETAARAIAQAFIPDVPILGAELAHWHHRDFADGTYWLLALDPSAAGPPTMPIAPAGDREPDHLAEPDYFFVLVDAECDRPPRALSGRAGPGIQLGS